VRLAMILSLKLQTGQQGVTVGWVVASEQQSGCDDHHTKAACGEAPAVLPGVRHAVVFGLKLHSHTWQEDVAVALVLAVGWNVLPLQS
jgi:hypothetical protein